MRHAGPQEYKLRRDLEHHTKIDGPRLKHCQTWLPRALRPKDLKARHGTCANRWQLLLLLPSPQAVGWFPLGTRKQGSKPFAAPTPPQQKWGQTESRPGTPPPACPHTHTAGRHMVIEVPPLAERGRTPNDKYVGIWNPHGNPAGGPPLPNK